MTELKFTELDYFENDGFLVVGGVRFYFQWDAKSEPTLLDVLNYLQNNAGVA